MIKRLALYLLLSGVVIVPRLYRFDRPLADWHSWRQADTVSVTREYLKHGIDLLTPTYHDLSDIPSGKDNPRGYRMVEFPILNALIAVIIQATPGLGAWPVHLVSRAVSIGLAVLTTIGLYHLVARVFRPSMGLAAALSFALMPFSIFFTTTALPENLLLTSSTWALYAGVVAVKTNRWTPKLVFGVLLGLSFLIKPMVVFLLPGLWWYHFRHRGIKSVFDWQFWGIQLLSMVPLLLWRTWIARFPEGIPASDWLLNGSNIRFTGAFFRWIFAERIAKWMLGYFGIVLVFLGWSLRGPKHSGEWLRFTSLGLLAYLVVFATGNVTHDYYQMLLLPTMAVLIGVGVVASFVGPSSKVTVLPFALASLLFAGAFSWFHVRDLFNINNPAIVEAGRAVARLTPEDAKVIAPYMGDTAFLYQTDRTGWPVGGGIQSRVLQGATHYVTTTKDDEATDLVRRCRVLEETRDYLVIELTDCDWE